MVGKTKVRFDGLDVAAMVTHLNRVAIGRRVINIYNGPNGDTYIFKLDKGSHGGSSSNQQHQVTTTNKNSDTQQQDEKGGSTNNLLLLLESGVRFHTIQQSYDNPGMPSQFCAKLRKHIRGLRLESITQLGKLDRVIHFVFGSGDTQRHSLMLELYARGNVVLTDSSYTILTLLRSHEYTNNNNDNNKTEEKDNKIKVKVGHAYPVTYATTLTSDDANNDTNDNNNDNENETLLSASNPLQWYQNQSISKDDTQNLNGNNNNNNTKGSKKKKKDDKNKNSSQNAWKTVLMLPTSGVSHYGPSLLEHCLRCAGLWGINNKRPNDLSTEKEWLDLQSILQKEGETIVRNIQTHDSKGYILYEQKQKELQSSSNVEEEKKDNASSTGTIPRPTSLLFDDKILLEFQPHLLKQHESMLYLEYTTFDRAVDIFFSQLEGQKLLLRAERLQIQAEQKLENVRSNQEQRITSLLEQQEQLQEQAQLVELHADMVEKAIQVVNSALDSGMDWEQLEDLVELEKTQNKNLVAMLIHTLDLEHDQMVLRLSREEALYGSDNNEDDDANDTSNPSYRDVTISLNETAHGNATALFAKYRASKEKSRKTIEASTKALEAAEEGAKRQLLEAQNRKSHMTIQAKRKPLWFEKFNWFITTDNYLVLAGRDAQQNELLVKRYLRAGDAYLHADVHGAASCVLRAKRRREHKTGRTVPIPLSAQALREAGNFTICRSSAWSSRMVTSAWWVESHQVSKTAPTGEYLTVGSFMVRGKKNFLPPSQLEMGLAVLFRLGDDDSVLRHKYERRDFALMQIEAEEETQEEDTEPVLRNKVEKSQNQKKLQVEVDDQEGQLSEVERTNEIPKESNNGHEGEQKPEEASGTMSADEGKASNAESNVHNSADADDDKEDDPLRKKKGLSIKERKLIKKYGSLEAAREAEEQRQREEEEKEVALETSTIDSKLSSQESSGTSSNKRGKKAKLKRMAKKYADQDEEDRELALLALHAGEKSKRQDRKKTPQISEKEKEAAAETMAILKKDSASIAMQLPASVREILAECVTVTDNEGVSVIRWDKFDGDVLEQLLTFELEDQMKAAANRLSSLKESSRIDNFSASLAGIIRTIRKYGHEGLEKKTIEGKDNAFKRKKKHEKDAEDESWKRTMAEEGVVGLDEEDEEDAVDDTVELGKLTGKPQNEDLILFAVPVCAPYQSLTQYTYRVKLTPGNMKRGKASKQCVEMFLKDGSKSVGEQYRDLIKQVPDNEWVQAICSDVKISSAGASKAIQKSKAKAKNSKKKK